MIKLIGIPFDANSSFLKGPSFAPERIRLMDREGSANSFSETGLEVKENVNYLDCGDMHFEYTNAKAAFNNIESKIKHLISDKSKVISFGGDHSISYPIISAFTEKNANLNILHLDAHADLYDAFDNNPFSHASPFARLMESNRINSLTQVGIRTLNTHQREQAIKFGVNIIEMKDFDFNFIQNLPSPLYVSIDLDVLDPAFAPGVSHHELGGMTSRQIINIIQNIPSEIIGADIVEYNPIRDLHNMTAMVAYKIFKELVAKMNV
ncbi:agmatinase [Tenacibaculum sp. MAR_2009_124]|uniref:agmatinase n=1 Tax=Tenacibaculum sp. MAR_2009_124 TaxID=1250059 RepID=UPI000898B518|nr:agmatinase [Tenacibaculum sp. MAR_2009_124]SEB87065.1 agmatinase [Tenacibaculum sp. MAR_2009_124]